MATLKPNDELSPLLPPPVPDLQQPEQWRLGLLLATVSGLLFTANNFFIQYFQVDALEILLVRSVVQCIVLGVVLVPLYSRSNYVTSSWVKLLVFLQAMFGGFKLLFNFTCLRFMPLGDALTLIFTEPLFTVILSLIFLRIRVGPLKLLCCLGLFGGMILSVQPPFLFPIVPATANASTLADAQPTFFHFLYSNDYFYGAVMAISCAVCGALCNILINRCGDVGSVALVFHSGLAGALIAVVGCFVDSDNRILFNMEALTWPDWGVLLLISCVGVLAYCAMTQALKTVSPTSVSVMRAMEIVLAYACQVAIMGQVPNLMCLLGAGLVMTSVVGIAVEEKFYSRSQTQPRTNV